MFFFSHRKLKRNILCFTCSARLCSADQSSPHGGICIPLIHHTGWPLLVNINKSGAILIDVMRPQLLKKRMNQCGMYNRAHSRRTDNLDKYNTVLAEVHFQQGGRPHSWPRRRSAAFAVCLPLRDKWSPGSGALK